MSSLADLPELVGFFSYSRDDDEDAKGALSNLRDGIQRELRSQLGHARAKLRLWQDKSAIPEGRLWEEELRSAIAESVFFIPIITPTAVRSRHCKREFDLFLAREAELGRRDLVFPILYIRVPALEDEQQWRRDPTLSVIAARQYADWRNLRHLDIKSSEVGVSVEHFCRSIFEALRLPWESPQERRDKAEAAAKARAEEEARQSAQAREQAAEAARRQRAETEARRQAEEAKRKAQELQAKVRAEDDEHRNSTDAPAAVKNARGSVATSSGGADPWMVVRTVLGLLLFFFGIWAFGQLLEKIGAMLGW
jgi:hypothetical protein